MILLRINIYTAEKFSFTNNEWYKSTKINYSLLGRRLFKNNGDINNHFPVYLLPSDLNLFASYLSIFEDDDGNYDSDFEMGFNNFDSSIERNLIYDYLAQSEEIYCIVAHLKGKRNASDYPLFNNKSPDYIEDNYQILYKGNSEVTEYIVKIHHKSELERLEDFIIAYFISPEESQQTTFPDKITPLEDIDKINCYTQKFKLVVSRAKLYANHNLVIYSACESRNEIIHYVENFCRDYHFNYDNYKIRAQ